MADCGGATQVYTHIQGSNTGNLAVFGGAVLQQALSFLPSANLVPSLSPTTCRELKIIHTDFKPENVMLVEPLRERVWELPVPGQAPASALRRPASAAAQRAGMSMVAPPQFPQGEKAGGSARAAAAAGGGATSSGLGDAAAAMPADSGAATSNSGLSKNQKKAAKKKAKKKAAKGGGGGGGAEDVDEDGGGSGDEAESSPTVSSQQQPEAGAAASGAVNGGEDAGSRGSAPSTRPAEAGGEGPTAAAASAETAAEAAGGEPSEVAPAPSSGPATVPGPAPEAAGPDCPVPEVIVQAGLSEEQLASAACKLVDFGNACWTYKQFTEDVQTRQYRCELQVGCAGSWAVHVFIHTLMK